MARVVKVEEHAGKRKEILDAAQRLVFSKGYEQMSIQDIIGALQISKGAFYHYFGSKQALLDGLIDSMLTDAENMVAPIVADPNLTAVEKLRRYFDTAVQWKTAQKEMILALLRIWYADHNAIVRQKQQALAFKRVAPWLATIIQQGVAEGVFTARYPEQTATAIMALIASFGETWAGLLLAEQPVEGARQQIECGLAASSEALERVLGAPAGSLPLMDAEAVKEWVPE